MDHRARLAWARSHIQRLEDEVGDFLGRKPYQLWIRYHDDRSLYVVTLRVRETVPSERWGLIVGDAIHGMRSALDNLAFSLWVADMGREPTQAEAIRIQFPITDNLSYWESERKRRFPDVSARLQAAFERAQPYHRRKKGFVPYLTALRDLSNVDKHRQIHVIEDASTDAGVSVVTPDGEFMRLAGWRGKLIDQTKIGGFDVRDDAGNLIPKSDHPPMKIKGHLSFDVRFKQGWPGRSASVIPVLRAACDHIEHNIFRWLEPLL